ncbi:chloride channel protein [Chitinasiproducens palmae]|uniref:H+/Cl-antiporter ClcA n=1 Tax=Chitinasiproducens palmae TaxID=1770053 RepID=A0A1H2PK11_9BURK|nr:chloride channel protein [Chitinasiproducens palmae]SDV46700.1 H+/Cl-antiporter ClcA [Chitinasiproducens palmae]
MPLAHHKRDFARADRLAVLIALAVVIGVLATLAAAVLLALIHLFTNLFYFGSWSFADRSPAEHTPGMWAAFIPILGGLIVGLIARFGSSQIRGHGIPEAIEAILYGKSRMSAKVAVLKPLASGIAIGSGGPFGAEGPIIMTGGALGSLLAQRVALTAAERKTMLVAGATAGMTAVFGTPVAAVLLAVELLLFEWRPRSFLPVALACAVAGFGRAALFGTEPLFALQTAAPDVTGLLSCLLAGLLSGALAAGLSTLLYRTEDLFSKLPVHWMWWPALAGIAVGIGGLIEPRALGVGYDVIGDLLHQHLALQVVVALLAVKAVIWVVALASGTSGGVLAPLLMLGAGLGVVLSHILPGGDATLWPLVCMAATLGATLGAPLTAIVFAFGVTHDAQALLPLLAATLTAHGFVALTMRRSIMTEKIARRGRHVFREYGVDPLERHHVDEIMSRQVQTVDGSAAVHDALATHFGATQLHRAYPVVDGETVLGFIDRQTLQGVGDDARQRVVRDVLAPAELNLALPTETCRQLASRLAAHGVERAAVVDDVRTRRLLGIVTRSDLLKPSASHFDDEHRRERF